ncbi:alpha/beta hydrolase [Sphaerisporangium sp. NPDC051011]|uniref:alpha/beta hydrolase n=1 Tax=Sphaerisporangium sp. NPDC051011 TaxID=3155792 RepID=UPI0033FC5E1F
MAVPVTGAARPGAVPAPVPPPLPSLGIATPAALAARYAATRDAVRAAGRVAAAHGDVWRAAMLRAMADPARHFLSFDGRDGGRVAEVFGDLSRAERIAVVVPGSDTSLDKYGLLRGGSMRLHQRLGDRAAVVAWLGYRTPNTVSLAALTSARADEASPALGAFVRDLGASRPGVPISLLCHSYGSVVCARAASGPDVTANTTRPDDTRHTPGTASPGNTGKPWNTAATGTGDTHDAVDRTDSAGDRDIADIAPVVNIVLYGSAGVTVRDAAALRTRASVWAGRSTGDWIGSVPHVRIRLPFADVGFGADPVSPAFGARVFTAGDGGHSDYLRPGPALENIARIVSGPLPTDWILPGRSTNRTSRREEP